MPLSLKAMDYFTTALRHGSITSAAAELNITPSAVSSAIDQVEAEFGLTLVTRQRARGIQANASGKIIARKCEHLLEEYRSVIAEGVSLQRAQSGPLRVGYYAPIAPAFLPKVLRSFLPEMNDVQLSLDECDNDTAQIGLLDGTYDAILFVAEDVRPSIEYEPLVTAPPYCLLPAGHALAAQHSVSMADISQQPLVVLNRPVAVRYYESLFSRQARDAPIVAYANSTEMVRSLVAAGYGCALLNMRPLTDESYGALPLVARPISDELPALTLAIGYHKRQPRRLTLDFVQACKSLFRSHDQHRLTVSVGNA